MTEPTGPALAPAGWYPTAAGSPTLRWWDGTQWTNHEHTIVPAQGQFLQAQYGQQLTTPAGTSSQTVWIWIFAILPLAQLVDLPFLVTFYGKIAAAGLHNTAAVAQIEISPSSGFLAIEGIGFLIYVVCVLVGLFDYLALRSRGVVAPFHWAWTFLAAIVYAIGRAVVVRRRTGSGLGPMWVYLAATLVSYIGVLFVVFSFAAAVARDAG